MKEAYAVRRTVPPSAEIEEQIEGLLAVAVSENPRESLSELARLGARLIIQRAVEEEFDAWSGRARYERRGASAGGLGDESSALRNGFRPRKVHTLEGELEVDIPQARAAAEPFVSKLFPCSTKVLRTEPLRAMVIGAFVRGLSMRDIEALCAEAGLGSLSKATASRICQELRERYEHFKQRDLYGVQVVALFVDAVFLRVGPPLAARDPLQVAVKGVELAVEPVEVDQHLAQRLVSQRVGELLARDPHPVHLGPLRLAVAVDVAMAQQLLADAVASIGARAAQILAAAHQIPEALRLR